MKLLFIIRCVKSNIAGTPSHVFVMVIWRSYLPWEFAVAICCGNLPQLFALAFCRGNLPQLFVVAICRKNLPWLFAVGLFCVCKQTFFLCNQILFLCKQIFFIWKQTFFYMWAKLFIYKIFFLKGTLMQIWKSHHMFVFM